MEAVQAVDIGNPRPTGAQQGRQAQQPIGFGPDIISREIVNPGIDEQNMGGYRGMGYSLKR